VADHWRRLGNDPAGRRFRGANAGRLHAAGLPAEGMVEQMDRNTWWWMVYDPSGDQLIEDIHMMSSMEDAFVIAETVYLVHQVAQLK